MSGVNSGPPTMDLQLSVGAPWWLPTVGAQPLSSSSPITFSPHGSNYNGGIYTWTAADGCPTANGAGAREPQGAAIPNGPGAAVYVIDPGFLCGQNASGQAPQVNFASIPGIGANQATGTAVVAGADRDLVRFQFPDERPIYRRRFTSQSRTVSTQARASRSLASRHRATTRPIPRSRGRAGRRLSAPTAMGPGLARDGDGGG